MKYTLVVGLEIHVELNTKTKMFCGCSAEYFGKKPNTHTCPVCLGLPGALPFANNEAIKKCVMVGLALNCKISSKSIFERKNYFYPDLPKGYQISQYRQPLCTGGYLEVGGKKIRVNRVHQEEDTGKLSHVEGVTQIDFNRSGVPLVEMVTEPDFETVAQVVEFAKNFQNIVRGLGVSNADMERGDLRLEANISLSTNDTVHENQEYPDYHIELKNINSFRFMQHALEFEIKRQTALLGQGVTLSKETRGWNEDKRESYLMRSKEEAHDYRYFPEPDLPGIDISESDLGKIKGVMPKLSSEAAFELTEKYKLPLNSVKTLISQGMVEYFKEVMKLEGHGVTPENIVNTIINKRIDTSITSQAFIDKLGEITAKKEVSQEDLEIAIISTIKHNEKAVGDYKKGKESVIQFLVGLVMRETKGKAYAGRVRELILERLNRND